MDVIQNNTSLDSIARQRAILFGTKARVLRNGGKALDRVSRGDARVDTLCATITWRIGRHRSGNSCSKVE
jgi:hypothetical protein